MSTTAIEKRLAAIEQDIARLKRQHVKVYKHPIQALEQIHGAFENDEPFQQATRLGRQWRQGKRPRTRKAKVKRA